MQEIMATEVISTNNNLNLIHWHMHKFNSQDMSSRLNILILKYKKVVQYIQFSLNRLVSGQGNQKYEWTLFSIKAEPKDLRQNILDQLVVKLYSLYTKVAMLYSGTDEVTSTSRSIHPHENGI